MAIIISGKDTSAAIRAELKIEVETLKKEKGITPGLAVVIVGSDPASKIYVRNKHRACEEIGMLSEVYEMPEDTTEEALLALIDKLNANDAIHGILVQLPLPKHLDEKKVIYRIHPEKDVDVFHPYNVGLLSIGNHTLSPCTPAGCMELLKRYNIEVSGEIEGGKTTLRYEGYIIKKDGKRIDYHEEKTFDFVLCSEKRFFTNKL